MIAIIGSGKLTNYLIKKINNKNYLLISGTNKIDSNIYNVGRNLKEINKIKLPSNISHCIINWSHTYINKFNNFQSCISGFERISDFIIKNPKVNFIFISSTSASIEVNKYSLYGLSKFIAESIFLKIKKLYPEIRIRILRPGMIYGLQDCPIKTILSLRRLNIELYPGNPEVFFPVTSANDLSLNLLNTNSIIWKIDKLCIGFYEPIPINLKYIHKKFSQYNFSKKSLFRLYINQKSILLKLMFLLGKEIDLSLSNINRFPQKDRPCKYLVKEGMESYIKNIFK